MSTHVLVVERYSCPWCPTVVVNVAGGSAMSLFEQHLDGHYAAQMGGQPGTLRRVPAPRRRLRMRARTGGSFTLSGRA